jgi:hypothetical protein
LFAKGLGLVASQDHQMGDTGSLQSQDGSLKQRQPRDHREGTGTAMLASVFKDVGRGQDYRMING